MGATEDNRKEQRARRIVSHRLRQFYSDLKAAVDASNAEFCEKVLQQAQSLEVSDRGNGGQQLA
jgi:hypothetical protein